MRCFTLRKREEVVKYNIDMYKSIKVQSLCGCGRLNWPVRRFLRPNKTLLTTSSPTTNPPFFFRKFRSTNTDSKKSTRWPPSVVSSSSSSASKFPVANSKSFLSISSSHDDRVDQCNALLRNTIVIRSFSSVRNDFPPPGEKSPVCALREDEKTWEDLPQRDAVVSVSGHAVYSDFADPWIRDHTSCFGTGLILSGRRVLTAAHSVDNHTLLEVRNDNYAKSYTATMLAIAPEYDLAILTVDDDEFWEGLKPVEFGDTPSSGDKVIVDYYREDRDSLLLMTARVLRLGMTRYSFWGTELLAFQVNVGSEGATSNGPAFDERGKCVGLKLQSEGNTSDFIPAEVIKHFIQDYDKNGAYTGLPLLGIKWQEMENPYLRAFMKMEHDQQGILITEVMPNYPESVILKPYDVILSIDGININNDGTVPFLRGRRIEFSYLISKKYTGDKVVIKVHRGSEICEFITELATHKQFVPANIIGRPVRYYIIGGFAFTTLSFPYILFMDEDEDELFSQALYEEHVVLCEVLEDDINDEYKYLVENQVLVTFNNKPVEGLKSLVSMVETCNEDFMKFTFRNHKILVLPTNIARSRTPDILKAHSVSCAMSDDLKELVKLT